MNQTTAAQVRWWVPGDWNGFFGLFTNVLLNVIVLDRKSTRLNSSHRL